MCLYCSYVCDWVVFTTMTDTELNEAVARKLGLMQSSTVPEDWWERTINELKVFPLPDYCHSIQAAWEIVGYCDKMNWHFDYHFGDHLTPHHWAQIFRRPDGIMYSAMADTAPEAICRAFLKVEL